MNQHLINFALALAAGELAQNAIEAQEVRKKVKWLKLSLAGKPYKDSIPFKIDTRVKSYGISLLGLIVTTAIFYGAFSWLNLSLHNAITTMAVLLVLAYIVTAVILDKYHVEIHQLMPPLATKKNR